MNTYEVDLMGRRRRHTAELKVAVIEECLKPGVSIATVALAHSRDSTCCAIWSSTTAQDHRAASERAAKPEPPSMAYAYLKDVPRARGPARLAHCCRITGYRPSDRTLCEGHICHTAPTSTCHRKTLP